MSNSPLVTYTKISPNKTIGRNHKIDTITIHCFVGQVDAKRGCEVFQPTSRQASCNYVVGYDGSIGLVVDEKDRSWCSSNSANDNRAITFEVASDNFHPYAVTDAAYNALINLLVDVCERNGIKRLLWKADKNLIGQVDKQNMTVHRWFANKACPGDYLYERHGKIADEVNARLEDNDMTQEKFNEMFAVAMNAYRRSLQDNDAGSWSEEDREWAIKKGLFRGSGTAPDGAPNYMWEDMITREAVAALLHRYDESK